LLSSSQKERNRPSTMPFAMRHDPSMSFTESVRATALRAFSLISDLRLGRISKPPSVARKQLESTLQAL
jgi:hypothetical protein